MRCLAVTGTSYRRGVQLTGPTLMFTAPLGALLSGLLLIVARPRR